MKKQELTTIFYWLQMMDSDMCTAYWVHYDVKYKTGREERC